MKNKKIYFVEDIILDEQDFFGVEDEYINEDEIELIATGGTIIRMYNLIDNKINHIDTIFGSVGQNSKILVECHLKLNKKYIEQL